MVIYIDELTTIRIYDDGAINSSVNCVLIIKQHQLTKLVAVRE